MKIIGLVLLFSLTSLAGPPPATAAPSVIHVIQSVVKRAIVTAPANFAGILGNQTEPDDTVNGVYAVSSQMRALCSGCDMDITDWHKVLHSETGVTEPEYWEFALSVHLGTMAPADIPALIRKILSPVIPASYKYTGVDRQSENEMEMRWRSPNGLLIRAKCLQTVTPPTYWYAIIYVQHTVV
jgi:hypothetical protein